MGHTDPVLEVLAWNLNIALFTNKVDCGKTNDY